MHATDPTFSLLDESKTFNKTQIRDKNVPRSGKCKFFFFFASSSLNNSIAVKLSSLSLISTQFLWIVLYDNCE